METSALQVILLLTFGAIAVAGAIGVIISKRLIYSALCLLANFAALGALYIMLSAEFLGMVQFIVYAGAITVLFLFALMFVGANRAAEEPAVRATVAQLVPLGLAGLLLVELLYILLSSDIIGARGSITAERMAEVGNIQLLGGALFTEFMLPFELASVLLLVGIVGAVALAYHRRQAKL